VSFLLQELLLEPGRALDLDSNQMNQLISEARSARLIATVGLEM
jgi:hypothetical protein